MRLRESLRSALMRSEDPGAYLELREGLLRRLERDHRVATALLRRRAFYGGASRAGQFDIENLNQVRREFIHNLVSCDYALCVRGKGNYSFRFFEALCLGRIPLLLDTQCLLPFEGVIPWDRYVVRVDAGNRRRVVDVCLDFHYQFVSGGYEQRQLECRRLWEDWLSPLGFFSRFAEQWRSGLFAHLETS